MLILKNRKFLVIFFLVLISIFVLNKTSLFEESDYLEVSVESICGEYPTDYVKEDISSNPNYVFVNDPNFESIRLLDEVGNTVFVNSFIECEHYVSGGWNFVPAINYQPSVNDPCLVKNNLREIMNSEIKVYLEDLTLKEFVSNKKFLCIGKVDNIINENNQIYYGVVYSRSAYALLSLVVPLLLLLLLKQISIRAFISILVLSQLAIQYFFHYNFGLNIVNSVSFFQTLFFSLIFYEMKK